MFTGIVAKTATVTHIEFDTNACRLTIDSGWTDLQMGESICVNGVCLTVMDIDASVCHFQVSPETLQVTTFKTLRVGDSVNLERALAMGDRFGGHVVTGHVDQMASIASIEQQGEYYCVRVTKIAPAQQTLLVAKGSVCINGVSLTINHIYADGFDVMLIPHTWQATNLNACQAGTQINIEFDYFAKLIAKQIQNTLPATKLAQMTTTE